VTEREERRRKIQRVSSGVEDHCHWCGNEGVLLRRKGSGRVVGAAGSSCPLD
jgi:hypothetical protein